MPEEDNNRQQPNPFRRSPLSEEPAKESAKESAKGQSQRPTARKVPLLALIRYHCPRFFHRPIIQAARRIERLWAVNSGDWHWIEQRPLPLKILNRNLWRSAEPSLSYYMMLFLSGVISTLGLLAGSTAAIIGAMIVAPLMGPIIGVAFAITLGNQRLLKRSGLGVLTGAVLTVLTAYCICQILGINTLNSEILDRTRPTLIDLAIGLAAGAAGSFATTRREVANALPGVAIAVALVPPLSVIGIGLAFESPSVVSGSTILFLTNLSGIILSGSLIFIWQDYGSVRKAKRGLTASTLVIVLLGIPLGLSLRDLIVEERARTLIGSLIRRQTLTFRDVDIRRLKVSSSGDRLLIVLEVAASADTISSNQVNLVREFLEEEMNRPITMNVSLVPIQQFSVGSVEEPQETSAKREAP